jgi:hypothetical protein
VRPQPQYHVEQYDLHAKWSRPDLEKTQRGGGRRDGGRRDGNRGPQPRNEAPRNEARPPPPPQPDPAVEPAAAKVSD